MQVKVSHGKENVSLVLWSEFIKTHSVYKTLLVVCLGDLVYMN